MRPRVVLRAEGLVVAAGATALYFAGGGSILLFALLILAPDLSMAGYLASPDLGARTYNAVHFYAVPAALAVWGWYAGVPLAVEGALIWATHVGVDRLFGFGLKYGDAEFSDTHLQRT